MFAVMVLLLTHIDSHCVTLDTYWLRLWWPASPAGRLGNILCFSSLNILCFLFSNFLRIWSIPRAWWGIRLNDNDFKCLARLGRTRTSTNSWLRLPLLLPIQVPLADSNIVQCWSYYTTPLASLSVFVHILRRRNVS